MLPSIVFNLFCFVFVSTFRSDSQTSTRPLREKVVTLKEKKEINEQKSSFIGAGERPCLNIGRPLKGPCFSLWAFIAWNLHNPRFYLTLPQVHIISINRERYLFVFRGLRPVSAVGGYLKRKPAWNPTHALMTSSPHSALYREVLEDVSRGGGGGGCFIHYGALPGVRTKTPTAHDPCPISEGDKARFPPR